MSEGPLSAALAILDFGFTGRKQPAVSRFHRGSPSSPHTRQPYHFRCKLSSSHKITTPYQAQNKQQPLHMIFLATTTRYILTKHWNVSLRIIITGDRLRCRVTWDWCPRLTSGGPARVPVPRQPRASQQVWSKQKGRERPHRLTGQRQERACTQGPRELSSQGRLKCFACHVIYMKWHVSAALRIIICFTLSKYSSFGLF